MQEKKINKIKQNNAREKKKTQHTQEKMQTNGKRVF